MSFASQYFNRKKADLKKLESYGFERREDYWFYSFFLDNGNFRTEIRTRNEMDIECVVYDTTFNEPYALIDSIESYGTYIGNIRKEYGSHLEDIVKHCFTDVAFLYPQTNRIHHWIEDQYRAKMEHPFSGKDQSEYGVYRHTDKSWFALIMHLKPDQLKEGFPDLEAMNLKIPEDKMEKVLALPSIYPAYHMSKKSWISVVLNDTLSDEEIKRLVDISYQATDKKKNESHLWVFPSDPKVWPLEKEFDSNERILWWQNKGNCLGDTVYLYSTSPDSCLLYKATVTVINVTEEEGRMLMELKRIKKFSRQDYPLEILRKYDLCYIRGPRRIPKKLEDLLKEKGD